MKDLNPYESEMFKELDKTQGVEFLNLLNHYSKTVPFSFLEKISAIRRGILKNIDLNNGLEISHDILCWSNMTDYIQLHANLCEDLSQINFLICSAEFSDFQTYQDWHEKWYSICCKIERFLFAQIKTLYPNHFFTDYIIFKEKLFLFISDK